MSSQLLCLGASQASPLSQIRVCAWISVIGRTQLPTGFVGLRKADISSHHEVWGDTHNVHYEAKRTKCRKQRGAKEPVCSRECEKPPMEWCGVCVCARVRTCTRAHACVSVCGRKWWQGVRLEKRLELNCEGTYSKLRVFPRWISKVHSFRALFTLQY